MFKTLLFTALGFLIATCDSAKENIIVNQDNTHHGVIIRSAKDNEKDIVTVQFPKKIQILNTSSSQKSFTEIRYRYNNIPPSRDYRIGLFEETQKDLKKILNNKKKIVPPKNSLSYVYYTRHFVDSTKATQQQFKPYVAKMLAENKDTLHIGTVGKFKQTHAALFEQLTKNDSIAIQFLDGKKLGERITVPVRW